MWKLDLEKARGQIANICCIIKKASEFQKNIYFCFIDYSKAFDYVDHNKLGEILKEMGIPDHLWPPDAKHWLTEKTQMMGKIEGKRRRV